MMTTRRGRPKSNLQGYGGVDIPTRDKAILSGLYLSKYDLLALRKLGFENFSEAYNVLGYALGSRPASIKNYRDEFDPLFPNPRKGRHKRAIRQYCLAIYEQFNDLDLESFTGLVKSFFGYNENLESSTKSALPESDSTTFAQRLITGLAAEHYFEAIHTTLPEFRGFNLENTTRLGCGFDFRMRSAKRLEDYLAVEVKGLNGLRGSLSMTPKEYDVAASLRARFFLFVVRNFHETPSHDIFQNPLASSLEFKKIERVAIQVSWITSV